MELLKNEEDRKKHWERVIAQLREEEQRTDARNEERIVRYLEKALVEESRKFAKFFIWKEGGKNYGRFGRFFLPDYIEKNEKKVFGKKKKKTYGTIFQHPKPPIGE